MKSNSAPLRAAFAAAAEMPLGLRHKQPGEPFDHARSEVLNWLTACPAIRDWIFQTVNKRAIVYDELTGTWHGKNKPPQ